MNLQRIKRPSPALVVATVALFVALGGTAGAVVNAAVPLAKRALSADNAKKLGGQTSSQIVSQAAQKAVAEASQAPGPASSAQGIMTVKSQAVGTVANDDVVHPFRITCDSGQKIMAAGHNSDNVVLAFESYPLDASTWHLDLAHFGSDPTPANVTLYAVCIK